MAGSPDEQLLREYYEIFQTVNDFDKRLMTVKGWGVTLSMAALVWGFQYAHYGMFLVAALSGLAFWLIEGTMKQHQMRYYLRMREIEVMQYDQCIDDAAKSQSTPRIDSSWSNAAMVYAGKRPPVAHPVLDDGPHRSYQVVWLYPHVFLPHAVSVVAGLLLLLLGMRGELGSMTW